MEHLKKPARHVLLCTFILLTLIITSCKQEGVEDSISEGEITENQPIEDVPEIIRSGNYIEDIKTLAGSSSCAAHSWTGRSRAPVAYIKGMALTYARSYCRLKQSLDAPTALVKILSGAAVSSTSDALVLYSSNFSNLSMSVSTAGSETLRSLYTLGIGLGMRESSGKYCEGRDMSASNTSASTAEAGMFQTSYDSIGASPELNKLFSEYKADISKCFLDVFKVGVTCKASSISGSGIGAEYQAFNKSCPAFAAEYAMVMLRVRRNHYGPINRKEAELAPACNQMLKGVQNYIDNDVYACDDIL